MFFKDFSTSKKDRFFLAIPVLLGAGIAVYFGMTTEFPVWTGLTCLFISGVTTYYYRNYYIVFLSTLSLTIVFAGFSAAQLRTYYVDTNILPKSFGPAGIQGRIAALEPTLKGTKITLENLQIAGLRADYVPTRLRLHVNKAKIQVKTGQWIKARAMLKPPPAPNAPGAFDFQRHAYFQQIGAIGFTYGAIVVLPDEKREGSDFFSDLRHIIHQRIEHAFNAPDEQDVKGFAIALLTGNKQIISEDIHETVRAAGLAHLLAISGLHIGLVSALIFFCLRSLLAYIPALALRYPIKKGAAIGAIFAALFFTLLTGASIPTIRAFIMCAIVLFGVLLDRKAISLRTVAWAAIIILLILPESLLGASFQLSFAAVTALVAFYERAKQDFKTPNTIRYLKGVIGSSLIATLATTPFAAYHFNKIALYGVVSNLFAIPLTVFWIMPMGIAALILMPFGLESFALIPMGWGIEGLLWVAQTTANLPWSHLSVPALSNTAIVLVTLGGLILCLIRAPISKPVTVCFFIGAIAASVTTPQPDILISSDGRLNAIRTEQAQIIMSDLRRASYIRENWLRRWGQDEAAAQEVRGFIPCDHNGCRYLHQSGQEIIFNTNNMSLAEDCQRADILVTTYASPSVCPTPTHLIDAHTLRTQGAHAIYIGNQNSDVVTVKQERGTRPWTVYGE